jgi:hypothetical protein
MRTRLAALLPLLGLLLAAPPARAGEPAARGLVTVEQDSSAALACVVKAELSAGGVAAAFASLEQPLAGRLQVVVHPSARDLSMPRVTVSHTTVLGVLDLVGKLVPDLRIRIRMDAELRPAREVLEEYLADPKEWHARIRSAQETVVVLVDLAGEDEHGDAVDRKLRVYRVGALLTGASFTMDDLATALETAWEMDPTTHAATLKFHKETGLLICIGTPRHLQLAEEVIERLSGTAPGPSQAARLAEAEALVRKQQADAEVRWAAHETTVSALRAQVAELQKKVAELEKSASRPTAPAPVGR